MQMDLRAAENSSVHTTDDRCYVIEPGNWRHTNLQASASHASHRYCPYRFCDDGWL